MSKNFDEVKDRLPQLRGILDVRAERELYISFLRLYEFIELKFKSAIETSSKEAKQTTEEAIEKTTELVNNYITKLITNKGQGNNPLESLGVGTVTSIALSISAVFTVSGSPITENGTFSLTLISQSANRFFAGPTSGGVASPTFRAIVKEDINIPFKLTTETAADPTTTEYSAGTWGLHRNSTSGNIYLAYNNSGLIVKVQLV